jgi:hypothetical protein
VSLQQEPLDLAFHAAHAIGTLLGQVIVADVAQTVPLAHKADLTEAEFHDLAPVDCQMHRLFMAFQGVRVKSS